MPTMVAPIPSTQNRRTWENVLGYPQHVGSWVRETLDMIQELTGFPHEQVIPDRFSAMAEFLSEAERKGLITEEERRTLRSAIAPHF